MKRKLWQAEASEGLNPLVELYTVGDDYLLDRQLLGYDIQASKAHVAMLHSIGILQSEEKARLVEALDELYRDWLQGKVSVEREQEDGHMAIELYLIDKVGDIGKKVHTARSRNDQSLVTLRLYLKDALAKNISLADGVAAVFAETAQKAGDTVMPGYTHLQKAMPTTVAMWLGSFADGFADAKLLLGAAREVIDQNPLGSAAGFGISLPIDREQTTRELGFKKTQANPMYCGMSKGLFDLIAVQALNPLMVLAGKFAHDMLLFTTEEFGFMSLPDSFTTGSSIMPQKHNYDLFEIMRGHAQTFGAYAGQLQALSSGMGSGYQRDLQLTKATMFKAFSIAQSTLEVLIAAVPRLQFNQQKLAAAITDDMLSVTEINKLVQQGIPLRDAYTQVKNKLLQGRTLQ